ncbi:hypothetical protein [Streptomyces sp. NPDC002758]
MLLVVGDDLLESGEFVLFACVAHGRGERVVDEVLQVVDVRAEELDVAVGARDVHARGFAVVEIGGAALAAFVGAQSAGGAGWVEDAGHALAGENLQVGVGEQGVSLAGGAQDAAGELGGGGDAVTVGVGGGAADVFAVLESFVGFGEVFEAGEPLLEGQVVGEPGGVIAFNGGVGYWNCPNASAIADP